MPRRLPAEWEPLAAVWLAWPHNRETWPGHFDNIPEFFAGFACAVARTVPVRIIGRRDCLDSSRALIQADHRFDRELDIQWYEVATNDSWIRDYGPFWVQDSTNAQPIAVDFAYNAWGGKYPPWDDDARATASIARLTGHQTESSRLCLEGGALETDGQGRLLTTTSCLITPTRNPGWSKEDVATELHRRLGITEIVWLEGLNDNTPLIDGDDTDGHIDQVARFVDAENIVVAAARDDSDANHAGLEHIHRQLKLWASSTNPKVCLHRLFTPPPRHIDGQRVPESYCNFLRLGPTRLLCPSYGDPKCDAQATATLGQLVPHCEIETLDCRDVVWGLGALHCASRDQPL